MKKIKGIKVRILALCIVLSILVTDKREVHAEGIHSSFSMSFSVDDITLYVNQEEYLLSAWISYMHTDGYSDSDVEKAREKIKKDLTWKSSDASVVGFVTSKRYDIEGNKTYETVGKLSSGEQSAWLYALSEGTATITVKSSILNQSCKCKVTVKNAELTCGDKVFYEKNNYTFSMKGNAVGVSYASSNEEVAVVDEKTGVVKTKKTGEATISCIADNGETYTYKMQVKKRGLSYTKLTTYYYTGFTKGAYTYFPLVAKGIVVKSWKSSNKKICKVEKCGSLGRLKMLGTGKATITCTGKDGTKFKCKLTVVGGKKWGGLNGGYRPTLSTLKKHGYFKDINSVMDYGDVVIYIEEIDHEINLGNGNKRLTTKEKEKAEKILGNRYPGKFIGLTGGDYLCFTSDNGKKGGRIQYTCYYVDK